MCSLQHYQQYMMCVDDVRDDTETGGAAIADYALSGKPPDRAQGQSEFKSFPDASSYLRFPPLPLGLAKAALFSSRHYIRFQRPRTVWGASQNWLQSTMAAAWDHMRCGILQTPSGIRLHS
jgi:hypothetical protein